MDRRDFLRTAGLLGGAAAAAPGLAGCVSGLPRDTGTTVPPRRNGSKPDRSFRSMLDGPASESPITHVVVVMMENRSFDHYLGWLAQDEDFLEAGRRRYGRGFTIDGDQTQTYTGPGGAMDTAPLIGDPDHTNPWRGCGFGDPGHGWNAGRVQRDSGFLAEGSGNDELALGYYLGQDLPFTAHMAKRFTSFDRYHCSVLGPTYPNREYLHSGQSGGHKNNYLPIDEGGFTWDTIWQRLEAANVPARYYYSDLPVTLLWGTRMNPISNPITRYYEDCAAGTLPNVTFVDPSFLGANQEDDHPLADVRAGQRFLQRVFSAFARSPHWENGLFILTYDEWGGFFDHVAPPILADDRASAVDAENFGQAGFRVPTTIASPYARRGYVDHRTYDHTSVLRFLEWRFLGAPPEGPGTDAATWFLTKRDRHANNLGANLDRKRFDPELDFDLDGLPLDPPSAACDAAGATAGGPGQGFNRADFPPTIFEETVASGYLERVGGTFLG